MKEPETERLIRQAGKAEESNNIEQILSGIIASGNRALDALDSIAPDAFAYSRKKLLDMLGENGSTVIGKKLGFSGIHSYEEYKEKVPLTTFKDYEELAARISENGERNILTAKPVVHFCPTTGTTSAPKLIPLVEEARDLATVYTLPAALAMGDRAAKAKGRPGFETGKGLFLIEIGKMSCSKSGIPIGGISSTSVRASDGLLETLTVSPRELITPDAYLDSKYLHLLFALRERDLSWIGSCYMTAVAGIMDTMATRWQDLCDDIENGKVNQDVEVSDYTRERLDSMLAPDPERAEELRKIFSGGFGEPVVPRIWPKLSFIGAIGSGGFSIHTDKVKRFVGPNVTFCNLVIAASETIVAVANGCDTDEFILLPQAAFFEFIPEDDPCEVIPIDELEPGKKYEVVVTTLSGLYRYRLMDVIEVTGFYGQIPTVRFSHRGNVYIDIAGEKTTEGDLLRAVGTFERETGIEISEYAAFADMTVSPGNYVVLLEPDGEMDPQRTDEYAAFLEKALCQTFGYKYERAAGNINPVKVLVQQKQTHLLYRELQIMKGVSGNQLKPVRVLNTSEKKKFFTKMIEK